MNNCFCSISLSCLLMLVCSCAKPEEKRKEVPQPEIVFVPQTPINEYPEYQPNTERPPEPPPTPEPEIAYPSEPSYVVVTHPCFEGDPDRKLTLTKLIKKEKMGWFRKSRYFVYDCQGTFFCDKEDILVHRTRRAFEGQMICYESAQDQSNFSICKDSESIIHSTYKGRLTSLTAVIKGNSTTLYCDALLPL